PGSLACVVNKAESSPAVDDDVVGIRVRDMAVRQPQRPCGTPPVGGDSRPYRLPAFDGLRADPELSIGTPKVCHISLRLVPCPCKRIEKDRYVCRSTYREYVARHH